MSSCGGVIIHDNLLWDPRFDSITHDAGTWAEWSDTEHLLTPQLQPKATHDNTGLAARINIHFSAPITKQGDYAIVLLGTDIPNRGLDQMVRTTYVLGGASSTDIQYEPFLLADADGNWHMVFLTDRAASDNFDEIRLTWDSSVAGAVGGLYIGRYSKARELADGGWEILDPDDNTTSRSYGGQIYHAQENPQINRELRVPMSLLSGQQAFASPSPLRRLTLPTPVVAGTSLLQNEGFVYTSSSLSEGTVTYGDVFKGSGASYARIDYSAHFRSTSGTGTVDPFRWSIDDQILLNGPLRGTQGSAIIQIDNGDLVLRAVTGNSANAHAIRVDRVSAIKEPENFQWGPDDSLAGIYHRHGNTRPVVVLQRPADPIITQATGLYGYLQGVPGVTHRRGPYFGSRLAVREQR